MINGLKVLAIIPARGGSKGLLGKNIRPLGEKPLLAWTIETARQSRYIDRLVLSSEDAEIIRIARAWDCEVPFVRPAELSRDETPGILPILHALARLPGYDLVVKLQPTSPLRSADDIDACIERCSRSDVPACVSVVEPVQSPY
jgi:N-acylneuraminate cytidylyltransferase